MPCFTSTFLMLSLPNGLSSSTISAAVIGGSPEEQELLIYFMLFNGRKRGSVETPAAAPSHPVHRITSTATRKCASIARSGPPHLCANRNPANLLRPHRPRGVGPEQIRFVEP